MTLIPLPETGVRSIEWTMPAVNGFVVKSGWTGAQTVGDPGGISDGFRAKVEIAPGREERLPWRAFYGRLRGPVNNFRLPVAPQLACPVDTLPIFGDGRTGNQLLYSSDFAQSAWTKSGVTTGLPGALDPDGLPGATFLFEGSSTGTHEVAQAYTTSATARVSFSVHLRYVGGTRAWVRLEADGGAASAVFQIINGTIASTAAGTEARIEAAGGGWYRVAIVFSASLSSSVVRVRMGESASSFSYTGGGNATAIWGAQFQVGPPSLYIPTSASGLMTLAAFLVSCPAANTIYLRAGQSITLSNRLYTLTTDLVSDGAGLVAVNVAPDLAALTAAGQTIECRRPYAVMRNTTPALGWSEMLANIDQPFAFDAEEAL